MSRSVPSRHEKVSLVLSNQPSTVVPGWKLLTLHHVVNKFLEVYLKVQGSRYRVTASDKVVLFHVTFVIAGIRGDEECTAAVESFYADQS